MNGKELKKLINNNILDDDIICVGEQNDRYGDRDKEIIGVRRRPLQSDGNNTYKVLVTKPYNTNGALKFWG